MRLLLVNGPNVNMLGIREPEIYGPATYQDLINLVNNYCEKHDHEVFIYQSNHEGKLIDFIQEYYKDYDGLIFNPAAYTHTSIALRDCISAITIPTFEVHISDVSNRESFRQVNFIKDVCVDSVVNEGINGYITAIKKLEEYCNDHKSK